MTAYYNEFDPKAAAWLRELIKRGSIADGEVDERSILEVQPKDLAGFTQCHFFAGIGGWSYALRLAGWPDDQPVWTGSPPCQPFSSAGQHKGKEDERHLAPHFAHLVDAGRPPILFGEQVASAAVFGKVARKAGGTVEGTPEWAWFDDLQDRLEAAHYAVGVSDIPAAGVGAPHIRQRTFFGGVRLADTKRSKWGPISVSGLREVDGPKGQRQTAELAGDCDGLWLANTSPVGCGEECSVDGGSRQGNCAEGRASGHNAGSLLVGVDHPASARHFGSVEGTEGNSRDETRLRMSGAGRGEDQPDRACPTNGFWRDADWLFCRDGKWRPVEPGAFPLAHGVPARVVRLRGYGNAIVPQAAAAFVESFCAALGGVE